jgi:hypothetical protein
MDVHRRNHAEATGDLIAYVNDDVIVNSGWVAGLRQAWAENPDAVAFTGLLVPPRRFAAIRKDSA